MAKTLVACALLGAALYLFLYSAMATASDAQGAVIFLFTLLPMAALLAGAIFLTRKTRLYRVAVGGGLFLVLFMVSVFIPFLNLLPAAIVGGVAAGYKLIYGMTPYEAHHQDVGALLTKAFEAQDRKALDLRGLRFAEDWTVVCVFGTGVPSGLPQGAVLPWSSVAPNRTAVAFLNDKNVVKAGLVESKALPFAPVALSQCLPRDQAYFQADARGELTVSSRPSP